MDNVIPITKNKRNPRPKIRVTIKTADTGTRPFLAEADDGNFYWCKQFHNAHGGPSTINEVVSSIIGKELGSPILDWKILDIPSELVGTYTPRSAEGNRILLEELPLFGTRQLFPVEEETDALKFVDKDFNYDRMPLLIALWILCDAQDLQLLFNASDDYSVYSLDHGMWFGSFERIWDLQPPTSPQGQTEVLPLLGSIPEPHWDKAINAVKGLNKTLIDDVLKTVPAEWQVSPEKLEKLVKYALSRKPYTIEQLAKKKRQHAGR
ncbi:MAG: hypothetical protein Q4A82_07410 [Corynebacterium sp.]|nr:hypothetical protein [Corynebacterium sp.]